MKRRQSRLWLRAALGFAIAPIVGYCALAYYLTESVIPVRVNLALLEIAYGLTIFVALPIFVFLGPRRFELAWWQCVAYGVVAASLVFWVFSIPQIIDAISVSGFAFTSHWRIALSWPLMASFVGALASCIFWFFLRLPLQRRKMRPD
jgi:hypothetical protein